MSAISATIRGPLPDYLVRWLKRDKVGVYSGLVERPFEVGAKNQRINPAWLEPRNAPKPWGIPCVDAVATIADKLATVSYRYEGSDSGADENAVVYELDTSFGEKPIQTHPDFLSLKDTYGWDDTERRFAEFSPGSSSGGGGGANASETVRRQIFGLQETGLSGGTNDAGVTSPLAGIDSFFSVAAIYRVTYTANRVPPGVLNGIGRVTGAPRGIGQFRLPSAAGKRNWLKAAPKIIVRGNVVQITEEYWLSHPGGWNRLIYSSSQL